MTRWTVPDVFPRVRQILVGATMVAEAPLPEPTAPEGADAWGSSEPLRRLFSAIASGDAPALGEVYDLTARRLYGLALWRTASREEAADVLQEVFVRLAERRRELGSVSDPRGWLLAVTHRLAVDAVRKASRRGAEPLDSHAELVAPIVSEEGALDARRASALLARLDPPQREVVYLKHFAGMTFSEIGKSLRIPTFTAASRYRLALGRLRRLMGGPR